MDFEITTADCISYIHIRTDWLEQTVQTRSDAAERGVCSGSTWFVTIQVTSSQMDLFIVWEKYGKALRCRNRINTVLHRVFLLDAQADLCLRIRPM